MRSYAMLLLCIVTIMTHPIVLFAQEDKAAQAAAWLTMIQTTPLPKDYQARIDAYFVRTLRDPDSRKIVYSRLPYGSLVCGTINARNGYGGYTGAESFRAYFTPDGTLELERYPIRKLQSMQYMQSSGIRGPWSQAELQLIQACGFL